MEDVNKASVGRWAGQRALSTPAAAIIMIVVILVVGGLGYVGLNAAKSNPKTVSTCAPATAAVCVQGNAGHDLTLTVPFKAVQQGSIVPFTATLPNGEVGSSYSFNFGDGSAVATTSSASTSHVYSSPGVYIVSATALVKGAPHDNYKSLVILTVSASFASASAGDLPGITGTIVSNSSSTSAPTAILQPGDSITLKGSYSSAPTNPLFALQPPSIVAPSGITPTSPVNTNTTAGATYSFSNAGTFVVSFVASTKSTTGTVESENYSWTVFVPPAGLHAGTAAGAVTHSLHAGKLNVYELAPGGGNSEDPAIDYETVGYEPIVNVYEALIAYNGSQTGPTFSSYVPVLATCVPGSNVGANNCASLYGGNTLISGTDYTFVIDSHARFYDPSTKNSWPVYPTDVMFSLARTMAFSTLPGVAANNGWLVTQSLLPFGNSAWDSIHGVFNNTPQNVLGAMTLNGTNCPMNGTTFAGNGCITFHVTGGGTTWPFFLELITDQLGASVVPCGWYSHMGSFIPGWTQSIANNSADNGDHPCGAPGSSSAYPNPATLNPMAWDGWETAASTPPFVGNTRYNMAGSGPYFMQNYQVALSYTLAANPAYAQNPMCTWAGCYPAPGKYASSVSVDWEATQVPGEQAYAAGVADAASIPQTDTSFLLQLIQQGKIAAAGFPTISIYFFPFNLKYDTATVSQWTSNPVNIPADWFSHVGMRQFFAHTYPYQTIEQTINTHDGLQYGFNYGGAIPQFMANYYPTNISWPTGDPTSSATTVGGAGWWWNQMITPSSPYYDSEAAACSSSNPCQVPLFGETGAPSLDQAMALWISQITAITGGAIKVTPIDLNFVDLVILSVYSGPDNNPLPVFTLGWAPDYPDPTDYIAPLYTQDGTYTYSDAVLEQTTQPAFDAASCHVSTAADWTWWSNQAQTSGIPDNCQGAAYKAMQLGIVAAATMAPSPARVLAYTEIEQIANALALYVYQYQSNIVVTTASYLSPTSMNSNVTIGGGGTQTWFTVQGDGIP
jgi:peptide/nickel transport system substrate-binding protein